MTARPNVTAEFRARRITPSAISNTGLVCLGPDRSPQPSESILEADYLRILSFDSTIGEIETQPVTLKWTSADQVRYQYTPDVLVRYGSADDLETRPKPTELIEVKPKAVLKAHRKEFEPKFALARQWARDMGWRFVVVTEHDIPREVAKNVRFLFRYRNLNKLLDTDGADSMNWQARRAMKKLGRSTPSALVAHMSSDPNVQTQLITYLWYCLANRQIGFDLQKPLTMSSEIWTRDQHLRL